jgi:acyl-CoA synthetase (AMP-forming)/AMP-acid ligase II
VLPGDQANHAQGAAQLVTPADPYQQALTVGSVPALHAADPVTRDKVAVTEGGRRLTWRELDERSTRVAAGLLGYGVRPGEPVALYSGNRAEYIELMYGLAKAGCPIVPLSPRFVAAEVAGAVSATGARALVTDRPGALGLAAAAAPEGALAVARLAGAAAAARDFPARAGDVVPYEALLAAAEPGTAELPEPDENVPFRLSLTSGTTGAPKVCVVPQRVAVQGWAEMSIGLGIGPDDVELVAGPLFHGLGFTCALQQLYVGGSLVIHRRFDAREVLGSIERDRATVVPGVPVLFDRILAELEAGPAVDASSVRLLMSSGARAGGPLKRRLAGAFRGAAVCEFLAGTETGIITLNRADPHGPKADSCGRPFFRTRVAILDAAGEARPPGEIGEVAKRGLLSGPVYLGDARRAEDAFHDGWFRTGDLGYLDEDGYLFLVGRSKDVIVSGGINVYPAEIEDVIRALPGVREVAVVGIPDETWGESVKAVLVLDEGTQYAPREIERHCRAELAGYKLPRVIAFAGALPRTGSGKVLSRELASVPGYRRTDEGWSGE